MRKKISKIKHTKLIKIYKKKDSSIIVKCNSVKDYEEISKIIGESGPIHVRKCSKVKSFANACTQLCGNVTRKLSRGVSEQ